MKLLLDENLSPWVALQLCKEQMDACHVRDRGMLNALDHQVLDLAYREDRILVTANVGDFRRLARARDLHAGIVLLEEGSLGRQEQLARIRVAVSRLAVAGDMTNRLLTIREDGIATIDTVPSED